MIGGGAVRAGDLLIEPGARRSGGACHAAGRGNGADRRRPLRRRGRDDRGGAAGARAVGARERAARRLPDADREPRGRHAARALRAARGGRRRLRGHAAHAHAARSLRRPGANSSPTTSTTRGRVRRSSSGACARGRSWRSSRTPVMPLVSDPGFLLVRALRGGGAAGRGAAGSLGRDHGAGRLRAPRRQWHFHGFLPRKRGELRRAARGARRDARRLRVAAAGPGHSRRCWRSSTRGARSPSAASSRRHTRRSCAGRGDELAAGYSDDASAG